MTKRAFCLSLLIVMIGPALEATPIPYNYQTLNNPGDPAFNQLLGINNGGVIGGYFGDGIALPNEGYTLSSPYALGNYANENFPGSAQTQVVGINSAGNTVGFWANGAGANFGFTDTGGIFTTVMDPLTPATTFQVNQLLGVNDTGTAVGFYIDSAGNAHAYTFSGGTYTGITLPATFNAVSATATDINNSGVISGFFVDSAGNTHGFVDNGGTFTQYDDPSGNGTDTMLLGLNNNGYLVGSYVDGAGITNGLLYDTIMNVWQTIDDPNQSATPADDITGTTVNGINDLNQLVGFYSDGANVDGMLASPASATPEPPSIALALAGALGLICIWGKKLRRDA